MDALLLDRPWVLLGLVPVWAAAVWMASPRRAARPGARGRSVLTGLAATFLLMALAGPSVRVAEGGRGVVVLVADGSASMAAAGAEPPEAIAAALRTALPEGEVRLEAFGRDGVWPAPETLLADALMRASWLPGSSGTLVLYTDGRETFDDAREAARRAADRGLRVHALRPDLKPVRDARVAAVVPLAAPRPGAPMPVDVHVAATVTAPVRLVAGTEGAESERTVAVPAGAGAVVRLAAAVPEAGRRPWRVRVVLEGDEVPENDAASLLLTPGAPRDVVYVGQAGAPAPLAEALEAAGVPVRRVPVEAFRPAPDEAAVVLLDNVSPLGALGRARAETLAEAVTSGGLGLVVLGGDASFASGGMAESPLEEVLPVTSRTAERPPLTLVVALDASGSMNEPAEPGHPHGPTKIAAAKEAVLALRPALGKGDRVGVVAFAVHAERVSPLVPVTEWPTLRDPLLNYVASGGTYITPAVAEAVSMAADDVGPRVKRHVLVLSDGRSDDFDVPALVAAATAAGVTISAVATGPDADRAALAALAEATGGRLYVTGNFGRLADLFLTDVALARGEHLRPGPLAVRTAEAAEPREPDPGPPPATVPALNPTRAKPEATVHWVTDEDEAQPVLATWQAGLGRAAALPWPAGRAADAAGLAARLAPVLRWAGERPGHAGWAAAVVREGGASRLRITTDLGSDQAVPTYFAAKAFVEGEGAARLDLAQVRPGVFESAPLAPNGRPAVAVVSSDAGRGSRSIVHVPALPPKEYAAFGVDRPALEAMCRAGGGRIHASVAGLAETVRQTTGRAARPAGAALVWAALAAAALLVGLRIAGKL